MLQFITNTSVKTPVVDQIKEVINGGGRWIQIRMKDASDDDIRKIVEEIKPLCEETETFLILNDRVELAKDLNVGGVHLGKEDMLPYQARLVLGAAAVIGVTVNTFADVESVRYLDVDYLGIGPYRFTKTKQNLAPVLGVSGIQQICVLMNEKEIRIPTVAVGGITLEDVEPLMSAGVSGIAVSGAIAGASDIAAATSAFIDKLEKFVKHE